MDWGLGRNTKGTPLATEDPRENCGKGDEVQEHKGSRQEPSMREDPFYRLSKESRGIGRA
jgi:hypothetical protein